MQKWNCKQTKRYANISLQRLYICYAKAESVSVQFKCAFCSETQNCILCSCWGSHSGAHPQPPDFDQKMNTHTKKEEINRCTMYDKHLVSVATTPHSSSYNTNTCPQNNCTVIIITIISFCLRHMLALYLQ